MRIVRNLFERSYGPNLPSPGTLINITSSLLPDGFRLLQSTASSFRAIWQWTVSGLEAGKRYAFRVTFRNLSATSPLKQWYLFGGTGVFSEVGTWATKPLAPGGICGVVYDCVTSGSITLRFGVGLDLGTGTHPWSVEVGDPLFAEIPTDQTVPPEFVYPGMACQINRALAVQNVDGLVVDGVGAEVPTDATKSIIVLGDSFCNDTVDWPAVSSASNRYKFAIYSNGISGRSMLAALGDVDSQVDLSAFNHNGVVTYPDLPAYVERPAFAIVDMGVNDNNNSATDLSALQNTVFAMVGQLVNLGVQQVIFFDIPPWSGNASWTAGKEAVRVAYNQWIVDYCQSNTNLLRCFKISRTLGVAPDYSQLITAFDSGDHLHPNPTGSIAIASALQNYLDAPFGTWAVSNLSNPGPPRNNITRLTGGSTVINPTDTYEFADTNAWRVVTGCTAGTANDFFDENGVPLPFTGQKLIDAVGPRLYCGLKGIGGYTVDQDEEPLPKDPVIKKILKVGV